MDVSVLANDIPKLNYIPPKKTYNENAKQIKKSEKKSIGIICCRDSDSIIKGTEILFVCRRCTYAFDLFMQGNYNVNNDISIINLLNFTTADEKLIILSLKFEIVFYYWWFNNEINLVYYNKIKNKFNSLIIDGGLKLKRLINQATHGNKIWEIPKGRGKRNENNLHTAVREFYEETGMHKRDYRLIHSIAQTQTYTDCDITYHNKYFLAECINTNNIKVHLFSDDVGEIGEVKWMNMEQIKMVDQFNRLEKLCRFAIKRYRLSKTKL